MGPGCHCCGFISFQPEFENSDSIDHQFRLVDIREDAVMEQTPPVHWGEGILAKCASFELATGNKLNVIVFIQQY